MSGPGTARRRAARCAPRARARARSVAIVRELAVGVVEVTRRREPEHTRRGGGSCSRTRTNASVSASGSDVPLSPLRRHERRALRRRRRPSAPACRRPRSPDRRGGRTPRGRGRASVLDAAHAALTALPTRASPAGSAPLASPSPRACRPGGRWNPSANPRPACADGLRWWYSSHSSARTGRWNHMAWSRLAIMKRSSSHERAWPSPRCRAA